MHIGRTKSGHKIFRYNPVNLSLLGSPVEINSWPEISKELAIFVREVAPIEKANPSFINYRILDVKDWCSNLWQALVALGLDKACAVLTVTNVFNDVTPPHVDSINSATQNKWSLNIPIANCEGSSTAFYSSESGKLVSPNLDALAFNKSGYALGITTEIFRVPSDCPYLMNRTVLHQVVGGKPGRLLACFRFNRNLSPADFSKLGLPAP
jgi:hypothetical protein